MPPVLDPTFDPVLGLVEEEEDGDDGSESTAASEPPIGKPAFAQDCSIAM